MGTTVELSLPHPYECRYFSMYQSFFTNFIAFCENSTHHRQYHISHPLQLYQYTQILEVNVSPNIEVASKLLIYRKTLTKN